MRYPGFIGPTYQTESRVQDVERCVNLYPQIYELGNGKNGEIAALIGTPGLRRVATVGSGPIRGLYFTSTGRCAVASGNKLYRLESDWTATEVGALGTVTGPVQMRDNGNQLIAVDGSYGYIVDLNTGAFGQIDPTNFPGATHAEFLDGYFVLNNPNTGQFFLSDLYNGSSYSGLDYATAEGNPDHLAAVVVCRRQVWLLGDRSTEVWWNSGASTFPFTRIEGSFSEVGCGAPYSAVTFANSVAWLGNDGMVYLANGYQPARISNHAVEFAIRDSGDYSEARAWAYSEGGHNFYCLDLPGSFSTWVFDQSTGQWHERMYLNQGQEEKHRACCHAYAFGQHVVGDREDGRLYVLDTDTATDDGDPIRRERIPPALSSAMARVFISQFTLDMGTGVGLDGTGQGTDPQVMLQVSRDGGQKWSSERWVSAGKIGRTLTRAIWRKLGSGRNMVVRIRITDPIRPIILGAEIEGGSQ